MAHKLQYRPLLGQAKPKISLILISIMLMHTIYKEKAKKKKRRLKLRKKWKKPLFPKYLNNNPKYNWLPFKKRLIQLLQHQHPQLFYQQKYHNNQQLQQNNSQALNQLINKKCLSNYYKINQLWCRIQAFKLMWIMHRWHFKEYNNNHRLHRHKCHKKCYNNSSNLYYLPFLLQLLLLFNNQLNYQVLKQC